MKTRLIELFRSKPLYLFLLPLFFILHGYMDNYDLVPVKDALIILGVYVLVSYLLAFLLFRLYKNQYKANLFTFWLLVVNFLFGLFYNAMNVVAKNTFFSKYIFLLPFTFLVIMLGIILLKKIKQPPFKIKLYINSVLFLLLLTDGILLVKQVLQYEKRKIILDETEFIPVAVSNKPDIYFIVPDGYAGTTELKDVMHFDNAAFIQQLSDRGFHIVPNSTSNYNITPFSMASIFNMSYLKIDDPENPGLFLQDNYRAIKHNRLFEILDTLGYRTNVYSIFDFGDKNLFPEQSIIPVRSSLLESSSLISHLFKIGKYNLANKFKLEQFAGRDVYSVFRSNNSVYNSTIEAIEKGNDTVPRFIYAHLLMPHSPYYKDKNGNSQPFESLLEAEASDMEHYVEYLQYTNTKLIELIDKIQKGSPNPPIIILMSDHGFRRFSKTFDRKYNFSNLMAVCLPDKNYSGIKDSLSNVNFFRVLLNQQFGQTLTLLKDTMIYLDRK